MAIRRVTARDIPRILRLLAGTPNPPVENEDSIAAILADRSQYIYVDTTEDVVVRIVPRPAEPDVIVVWWLWVGSFNAAAHLPVLGAALRAVKAAIPASGPWATWGDFPGAGGTDAERKADSERQAREQKAWANSVTTVSVSLNNSKMWEARATLDEAISVIAGAALAAVP